jgi:hypothetical protein
MSAMPSPRSCLPSTGTLVDGKSHAEYWQKKVNSRATAGTW